MSQSPCILIVDDEPEIRMMLRVVLERAGYRTQQAENGLQAVRRCREEPPDMVVMDVMMPMLDGIEACRRIRQSTHIPVILLTGRDEEDTLLAGFSAGAYDFLSKPFRPRELLARVRALLERASPPAQPAPPEVPPRLVHEQPASTYHLRYADLSVDPNTREVLRGGSPLKVTSIGFQLLLYFMRHTGEVITKDRLLQDVWGCAEVNGGGNMVEAAIKRLRKELGDDSRQPRYIKTIWGIGYRFGEKTI